MKEAEKILREIVGEDCIWEEMNNLTNTPIDLVVKAMDIYKNQALTIPVVVCSADFEKPSFQKMRKKVTESKQFTKKDGLYYHRKKGWKNLREAYEIVISQHYLQR